MNVHEMICDAIDELLSEEGSLLTLPSPNPDFRGPDRVIICSGYWTEYTDQRYEGIDLMACLGAAVQQKREYDAK